MIRTLRLENYRGFEEYELRDLAAVNLLVGPNNCGKTSVLEAVDLLASGGDPGVLVKSVRRRSEFALGEPDPGYDRRRYPRYPVHHQFHGHRIWPGSRLTILSGDGMGRVTIHVEQARSEQADVFDQTAEYGGPLRLRIERDASESDIELPLDEDGLITGRWGQAAIRERLSPHSPSVPIQFITAESLHAREMARVWDQVLVEGREPEVVDAMRILQDDLLSIHFLTGSASGGPAGGIVLGFKPGRPRTPIGSYGDGMRRMLAISLCLVRSADGFLLVDEIDTGLHWSVMEEMWRLVVEAAVKSSIQVFATTHSLDCIKGLASLLRSRSDLADAVSVQKIERRLDRSVGFDGEAIVTASDLDIELR